MGKKDSRVDDYIARSEEFARPILTRLRSLIHQGCPEVEETIKWGFPHFMCKGILCSMASFKAHCAFGFWNGDLLFHNDIAAQKRAAQAMGHFGRLTTLADLPPKGAVIDYIKEAARLNEQGIKPPSRAKPKERKPLVIPEYLTEALRANKRARETFDRFSYSHKKEYVEWITEAKGEATRNRRLQSALQWMAQGKARNWKYEASAGRREQTHLTEMRGERARQESG